MAGRETAFVGSIPPTYDRYLGPLFFEPYAEDLVARLPVPPPLRVLETACGTGIVTRRLVAKLSGQGSIVATDLNEPMLAHASRQTGERDGLEWRQADATTLPFDDRSFDAVVCQFGLMFYPDKPRGVREALRVLRPGGRYLFNVWDRLERNPATAIVHETVTAFFPSDPPRFFTVPHSLSDATEVARWLRDAGFVDVAIETVERTGVAATAEEAATAMLEGTPLYGMIMERDPAALGELRAVVAHKLTARFGAEEPVRVPLRAFVFSARRP